MCVRDVSERGQMEQDDSYSQEQSIGQRVTTRTLRRMRRVDEPRLPFAPYGLIPALGLGTVLLFGLFPFAKGRIEQAVERSAQTALSTAAPWATPEVSGQWVTLTGCAPSQSDEIRARDAVEQAESRIFLGKAITATRVATEFSCPTEADVAEVPAIAPPVSYDDWTFRLESTRLYLEGEVPDAATRNALNNTARTMIDPPRITSVENGLRVSGQDVPPGYLTVATRGLNTIGRCDRGEVSFISETFSLTCDAQAARAAIIRNTSNDPLALGQLGTIAVSSLTTAPAPSPAAVASCDASLAELLSRSKVEFAVSSAAISAGSFALIDRLATAIRDCPGTLVVEGHTDSTGNVISNDDLSRRRADAVRTALIARGVLPARIYAQGLGSSQPIASNQNANGRARNRRIEIRVAPTSN